MLNSQTNNRVNEKFSDALNAGVDDEIGHKNRFTEDEVIGLAKRVVEGEDLSELTDKQIVKMIDDAIVKTDIDNADEVSRKAQAEILRIANEQRESKFAQEMERVISEEMDKAKTEDDAEIKPEDIDFEQLESKVEETAENLIEMLAVEKAEDKEKYVQMVLDQLDSSALTEEQKAEIREKVDTKVAETIDKNYRDRDKERVNRFEAAAAFAKSENRFVQAELEKLDDSAVLSKEVRDAIDHIKRDVKHEKTKKGSIGTMVDLDRRLRHMRDIL
jgi:hypothetical protein